MRRVRDALLIIILLAVAARIIWEALAPIFPALLVGLALIYILGLILFRKRRW